MAKFEKGNKFGKGRPPGSPNKVGNKIKEQLQVLLDDNLPDVQGWINELEHPRDKIKAIFELLQYSQPKKRAVENSYEMPPEMPLFLLPDQMDEMKDISEDAFHQVTGRNKSCVDGLDDELKKD